jgi:hypothetical protein
MATAGGPPRRTGIQTSSNGERDSQQTARATSISDTRFSALVTQRQGFKTGFNGDWFPPNDPMQPQAPDDVKGRKWDYPFGMNLAYQPRGEQGQNAVSFPLLRRLADPASGGLDLLRLAIETRKDQMKGQKFKIVGREKNSDGGTRAREVEALLRKPDGINRWRVWMGMILEDHFVIDAPAIYFRDTSRGPLFENVDGATIKLLIDNQGRTPVWPLPAYQQLTKGLPAVDYTVRELGYYYDNPRPDRLYGMSRVEQVLGIVTIALNRQLSVLAYYTAGSIPDMIVGVPKEWNIDTIKQFQLYWESILLGNIQARRGVRFFPGDAKPYETKAEILKDQFDEWLARIICYCFSLPVQALVKETNRATAETAKESAAEEGLESTKLFLKDVIDDICLRIGEPDLQLQWEDEEIVDPEVKAKVIISMFGGTTGTAKPIITLAEAREMSSLPPATPDQIDELQPPPPEPLDPAAGGGGDGLPPKVPGKKKTVDKSGSATTKQKSDAAIGKAASSRGRSLPAVPKNKKLRTRVTKAIAAVTKKVIGAQRKALLAKLEERSTKLAKATDDDLRELLRTLEQNPWDDDARDRLRDLLSQLASDRSTAALDHVGDYVPGTDDEYAVLLDQANEAAVAWAQDRVGNLITEVSTTTQDAVNELVANAIEEGLTNDQLAERLGSAFDFSDDRALMIARTETANADVAGTLIGFRESGVVAGKSWDPDAEACPICLENADAGVIALDDEFPSGDDGPPAHPNCECSVLPELMEGVVVSGDEGAAADAGGE